MTTQQAGKDAGGSKDAPPVNAVELLEDDDGKSEADHWAELDAADAAVAKTEDTAAGKPAAASEIAAEGEAADGNDQGGAKPGAAAKDQGKPPDKPDPWATAPPEAKAAYDAAQAELEELKRSQHAERSAHGRELSALQRQVRERGGAAAPAAKPAAKANEKKAFQTDKGKSFQQEYPEVAAPVAEEIDEVRSELATLKDARLKDEERAAEAEIVRQTELLEKQHADWQQVTVDNPDFPPWLAKQPRHIREAVTRNADGIVDAEEAADVVGRYKAFRSSQGGNTKQGGDNAQDGPSGKTAQPSAEGKNGSSLSGKRQRQLESSSSARSSGPGAAQGIPEDGDEEMIWKAFDKIDAQEQHARRA